MENIPFDDLFDDDLYLCVISIFATFEIGGYLRSQTISKKLGYHFYQVLHQSLNH